MVSLKESILPQTWTKMPEGSSGIMVPVNRDTDEFNEVLAKLGPKPVSWTSANPTHMFRIQNPTNYWQYFLTRQKYEERYSATQVLELWHATDRSNVGSIVSSNFLPEKAEELRYGPAVAFACHSIYADGYANHKLGKYRALILSNVLVGETLDCTYKMVIPASLNVTVTKNYERVYLKYDRDAFYPTYALWYCLEN